MRLVGTELKLNLNMTPIGDIHFSDCPFSVYVFTRANKGYEVSKEECVKVDEDNYIVKVDTGRTGEGQVKLRVTIDLPDADFDDLFRREVVLIETKETIYK